MKRYDSSGNVICLWCGESFFWDTELYQHHLNAGHVCPDPRP